jgi:cytoskeletal protein RodZ
MIPPIAELAHVRSQLGLSIEQISLTTRISRRYLEAIEQGKFDRLPGGIYTTSYLRQYARAINYPESELIAFYLDSAEVSDSDPKRKDVGQESASRAERKTA